MIRQPIVAVLGHVDHGKTTLLDQIRGTKVASREAGGITQHIGATEIPIEVIRSVCGNLVANMKLSIPGLLFIDTPGHAAFTSLRSRGGNLADIAVLIVDINEGLQPQTIESISILKQYKTPFIIVLNKIDRSRGWKATGPEPFLAAIARQDDTVRRDIETKMWDFIGALYEYGFEGMRFDQVKDFTKNVAIVPASAKGGVGIPEIMMLIAGLSQRFLEKQLDVHIDGPAKGTVLEVKETVGFGTTLDVIVYDGTLRTGDIIVLGARNGVVTTKVRALLKPKPLDEIRDPRYRFDTVSEVPSAAGIKIAAPGLDEVLAGSPLLAASPESVETVKRTIQEEIQRFRISRDSTGIIVKADTLGSLEAIVGMLRKEEINIRNADIGDVQKRDVVEAMSVAETDPMEAAILSFNVHVSEEVQQMADQAGVPVIQSSIIYKLLEDYEAYLTERRHEEDERKKMGVIMPGKFQFLPKMVFRNAKPAIVGIEILAGSVMPRMDVINEEGVKVGRIKALKEKSDFLKVATKGMQVAMSIEGPIVGRQIHEGEVLYIDMLKSNIERLKGLSLTPEEEEVVSFLSKLKKKNIFAGV